MIRTEHDKAEAIPFHRPDISEAEISAVVNVLRSGWLTSGPKVLELEEVFSKLVKSSHALAVNSCTSGLHLALEACGIKAGDEVLVPTMTFTATAEAAIYLGAKPILCDVDSRTLNIDVAQLEKYLTPRTKAIVPVHVAGLSCDMDAILNFARKHKISVVEDAAHAFPTKYKGKYAGTIGDVGCYSFYATKTVTCGEGGMIATNREDLYKRMKLMRQHAVDRDAYKRQEALDSWYYEVVDVGFKYNLPDILAALALGQIERAEAMRNKRAEIAHFYLESLRDIEGVELPEDPKEVGSSHAWHLFTVRLNSRVLGMDRNDASRKMKEQGISCSVHFIPLHLHPYYRDQLGYKPADLPNASKLNEEILSLPLYPSMTKEQVQRVATCFRSILKSKKN